MSDSSRKYIIYIHVNKTNGKMYVGQTSIVPEKRWKNGKGYIGNRYFYNAIQKYGWDGFEHVIVMKDLSLEDANKYEDMLIKILRSNNKNYGYNIKFGGNNGAMSEESKRRISQSKMGHIVTKEAREKISKNHADMSGEHNPRYGVKVSEETRAKIKANNKSWMKKGIPRSDETKRKMRENHADFSGANHPQARAVVKLGLNGNYISTYSTAKEAAQSIGQRGSNITICCQNNHRTAGGYLWRYEDEYIA